MKPGEILTAADDVPLNPGRKRVSVHVANTSDRAIQVGSHYHFAAVNPDLEINHGDRTAVWGHRLDIPAGTAVRFEPGRDREVSLVPIEGAARIPGLRVEYAGDLAGGHPGPVVPVYGEKGEGPRQ